jgi:GNAT superfamily N-acetyltransferase
MEQIRVCGTPHEIERCFPVMAELRPHLARDGFQERIARQQAEGYRLAYLEHDGEVRAVAGYRLLEMLAFGRSLYVDDLVTRAADRSRGYGDRLFDWLVAEARGAGCVMLHLDSGTQRVEAHRFYFRKRMAIRSFRFQLDLR